MESIAVRVLVISLLFGGSGCGSSGGSFDFPDACNGKAPDAACYAQKRDPASDQVALATEIALRYIEGHQANVQTWDWQPGVLMFAMTELYRVTGDTRIRDYYKTWLDHHIDRGYRLIWSDSCPPAVTAIALLLETGQDKYREVILDVLDYLDNESQRVDEGGISHMGILGPRTLWLDSLFMFGMVLNRWGELDDNESRLDLMSEQVGIFSDLMQHENGLMVHAYKWPLDFDTDVYWARGNAWVTASLSDYLRVRAVRREPDDPVETIFLDQVDGILGTQDEDSGLWWTVMGRPGETYLETSATALFTYGIARAYRYGVVGDDVLPVLSSAVSGILDRIERDDQDRPFVTGISGPTDVGTFETYSQVPLIDDLNFGVGAVILALIETSGLDALNQ